MEQKDSRATQPGASRPSPGYVLPADRETPAHRVGEAAAAVNGSLGSSRTTTEAPRQEGDRAANSSWETDGGSGT
jgi:hypothetical protein